MKSSSANLLFDPLHIASPLPISPTPSVSVVGKQCFPHQPSQHYIFSRLIATTRGIWLTTRRGGPKALPETRPTRPSLAFHVAQVFIAENHRSHPKTRLHTTGQNLQRPNTSAPPARNTYLPSQTPCAPSESDYTKYICHRIKQTLLAVLLSVEIPVAAGHWYYSPSSCLSCGGRLPRDSISGNIAAIAPFSHRRLPK